MDVNTRNLRIFVDLMKTRSFSETARNLRITQPTVSQQIAKLERDLGRNLFERHGREITPTDISHQLYRYSEGMIEEMDEFYDDLHAHVHEPKGLVRYAMPESCQWTPHFKRIVRNLRVYSEIQFEIDILPAPQVSEGILSGYYDFGFITGERLTPELRFDKFSFERYSCVSSDPTLFEPLHRKSSGEPRFISFPGSDLFFGAWCKAHGLSGRYRRKLPRSIVQIGTLAGAIHAVQEGAGIAVLPTHCVSSELQSGALKEFKLKDAIAQCPIYLCRKTGGKPTRRAELIIDLLKKAKAEIG